MKKDCSPHTKNQFYKLTGKQIHLYNGNLRMLELYSFKKPFRYLWSLKKPTLLHPRHVHVMMKSRLAVQDEDDGDGSVKSSMLWFQGHEHHSTGFCASASRSLLPEGGWIGRISSSSTCGVGCMTTSWSWGMSAAAAARLVIDLLFTH